MAGREEALAELLALQAQEVVVGLLLSARDVKIALPCCVLSKASAAGSRVLVTPVRRSGLRDLAIDCGRWRGAPTTAVHMDYRQVRPLQPGGSGGGKRCGRGARWVLVANLGSCPPLFPTAAAAAR